ncbi:ArgS-related anticodon-binding protein NrtL [Streptomyces sp. VRA16 Mangrove soil]|uniref:ArgS-related anticodon-binding protein NrtL n=1 Tax=Streptomyces sp. VRA16 Mangrove soil TaxID=2817434 RepID=UPI001A9EFB9C|nr:DALR anticodon-binding domain-containing protein [Streptomyces sp. VRA16 Mangrove soil]MBO1336198.1 hypothetical protein [Streptomyces sp. VRA16 Mangrove soil]
MTPADVSRTVLRAVRRAADDGELGAVAGGAVDEAVARVVVERPRPGGRGDYATNVALQIAKSAGRPPRQIAEVLGRRLAGSPGIAAVDITGPGFLNLTLEPTDPGGCALVAEIRGQGAAYGHSDVLRGQRVELRIPADETRAAVVAEALENIARSQGADVRVVHAAAAEDVSLRPVPAPADPFSLGPDAARWALLHPAGHDRPRIGAELLAQRESNPLFRVRYAYARTRALSRNAADLGFGPQPGDTRADSLEGALEDLLGAYPRILLAVARHRAPDRLARYLVDVADALMPVLPAVLPMGGEKPSAAHRARLALAEAAGTVLAGGLTLLGIDAPEHV